MKRRVVVTGMGLLTPLGTGLEKSWEGVVEGRSGIGPITLFDVGDLPARFAGEVSDFQPLDFMDRKEARRLVRFQQFAMAAASLALSDARYRVEPDVAESAAVILGTSVGGLAAAEAEYDRVLRGGVKRMSPLFMLQVLPNMAPATIAIRFGFKGPNWTPNSACSTSAHALGEAFRLIQRGEATVALAGGAEAPICLMGVAGFCAIRALSTRNEDPAGASRPFDANRDGFVLSEGAAILFLEEARHATDRGARIYGELVGYGASADAHHLTAPAPAHEGGQRAMVLAMRDAGVRPGEIQHINAHATSTLVGDTMEAQAIRQVFGAVADTLPVTSTKSVTGHMTGAGGAAEVAFSLLAMNHGVVPPTINLENPEPDLPLGNIPRTPLPAAMEVVMSNSFGFGGSNVSLIMRRFEEES